MVHVGNARKIALWGTGLEAVRFMYSTDLNVELVIDSNRVLDDWTFRGLPVKKTTEIPNLKDYYIVIATSEGVYIQICDELLSQGLEEFNDFCYSKHIEKKLVVVHGNCHATLIKKMLTSVELFNNEYAIYPLSAICGIKEGYIRDGLLKNCDVFIHQDIRPDNSYGYRFSDEYILPKVREGAVKITIPNLYGVGRMIFPKVTRYTNPQWILAGRDHNGMFPHKNELIEELVKNGKGIEEIIDTLKGRCISEQEILCNFENEIEKIRIREQNWDIKMSQFILNNYKEKKLFYDHEHPTNIILEEIALQVLKILGICDVKVECTDRNDLYEEPVLPWVKEVLGMKWEQEYIREGNSGRKIKVNMTLDDYVREYVWWCHGIK